MGVLNLDNHDRILNKPLPAHDHTSAQAFEKEFLLKDADGKLETLVNELKSANTYVKLLRSPNQSNEEIK